MPDEILTQAIALASQARPLGFNPFTRSSDLSAQPRESLLAMVLDAYNGKRWQFFEKMPSEAGDDAKRGEGRERPGRVDINNLRQWIDTLSNTYGGQPVRVFKRGTERVDGKTDPVIEAVSEAYKQAEVNRVLESVDVDLNLLGNEVLRPLYDEAAKELVIHRFQSPCVRVVPNKLNARNPLATVLTGVDRDENGQEHIRAEVFTPTKFVSIVDGQQVSEEALAEPVPMVHCFNRLPDNLTRYWSPCIGPALAHMDIVLNNDLIGPMGYTTVMQGFAQAVVFGVDPQASVAVGPGRQVQFSGDPERRQGLEYVTPNAPILDVLEIVKQMVSMIRAAHGIPEGLLDVKTDATGAALVQANAPLAEMRERRGKVFHRIERDLLRATIRVLAGRDKRVPVGTDADQYDVSVHYSVGATQRSVADQNAREKFLLGLGVLTAGDIAVREFPERWDDADAANKEIEVRAAEKRAVAVEMNAEGLDADGKPLPVPPGQKPEDDAGEEDGEESKENA